MEVVYTHCAGLDVHKKTVVACRLVPGRDGELMRETRTFGTLAADLAQLADWLVEAGVTHVAMESTGVYWQPVWNALEERLELVLANAASIKAVPGRKTDVKDAEWIADLLRHGLIAPSFVPERAMRELRQKTRVRRTMVQERARYIQRLDKTLEAANLKLSSITSKVMTVTTREILDELLAGQTDPATLAQLAKGRLRGKIPQLERALAGRFGEHEQFMIGLLLENLDRLEASIERCDAEIARALSACAADIERLDGIPGVGVRVAEDLIAEVGPDMQRFPSAGHLASWARLCPGNDQSAGVRRSGRTGPGNKWIRSILTEAGTSAGHANGTALHGFYHRLAGRRGKKRAALATGHKILQSTYYILRDHTDYTEPDLDASQRRQEEARQRRWVRELERQGYQVTPPPEAQAS
jgi:transposase